MATIFGTPGDDILNGENTADILIASLGNDQLNGGDGVDTVSYTNFGSNVQASLAAATATFPGGSNRFTSIENLLGGSGDDILTGNALGNSLSGNGGSDSLSGLEGDDVLDGGAGSDGLNGGIGNDRLSGGADNDALNGDVGNDSLRGGEGIDVLEGGDGADFLAGDKGNDFMAGGLGTDQFQWVDGDGSDDIKGGADEDIVLVNGSVNQGDRFTLRSSATGLQLQRTNLTPITLKLESIEGFNAINGLGGDDVLIVQDLPISSGVSFIQFTGGDGNDRLSAAIVSAKIEASGGSGSDTLAAGSNNDRLFGNAGNDILAGGSGADELRGADSVLQSNAGRGDTDVLVGGAGNDLFVLGERGRILYDDGNNITDGDARNLFTDNLDGTGDFARILDFGRGDIIQLAGRANQYVLKPINSANSLRGGSARQDMGIFIKNGPTAFQPDELIGIVNDTTALSLTNTSQFRFVG